MAFRRLVAPLVLMLALFVAPAHAGLNPALRLILLSAPQYDPDAAAYFAALPVDIGDTRKAALNTFFLGLKSTGWWDKIEVGYILKQPDVSNIYYNIKNPATFTASIGAGSVTHTADLGTRGNGNGHYITTGFTPSSDAATATQNNSGLIMAVPDNIGTDNDHLFGATSGTHDYAISPRGGAGLGGNTRLTANDGTDSVTPSYTSNDNPKIFGLSRTSSSEFRGYYSELEGPTEAEFTNSPVSVTSTGMADGPLRMFSVGALLNGNEVSFAAFTTGFTEAEFYELADLWRAVHAAY